MKQNEQQELTIDQIIEASFDFSEYSEEEKNNLIDETSSLIMEASLVRSLTDSSEDVQEKFAVFIESDPDENQMESFIEENFPNFKNIVVSEIDTFLKSEDAEELEK